MANNHHGREFTNKELGRIAIRLVQIDTPKIRPEWNHFKKVAKLDTEFPLARVERPDEAYWQWFGRAALELLHEKVLPATVRGKRHITSMWRTNPASMTCPRCV